MQPVAPLQQARPFAPPSQGPLAQPGGPMAVKPPQAFAPPGGVQAPGTAAPPAPAQPAAAASQRQPPGRALALNGNTTLTPRGARGGFAANQQNPDGSRTVMVNRTTPTGAPLVSGFRQTEDRRNATVSRLYSQGYRVTQAPDYSARRIGAGASFFNYTNGLRAATFANGQPFYREKYGTQRLGGAPVRIIERTVYADYFRGAPYFYRAPVVRTYYEEPVYGIPVYVWRPRLFERVFYSIFWRPLAVPVVIAPACVYCPGRVVSFASPVESYADPIDLMGDLQISSAFAEGAVPVPADAPEMASLRGELGEVQQQVQQGLADNTVRSQLAAQGADPDAIKAAAVNTSQAIDAMTPVQVPEEVRQEIRQQVRLAIAQHENGHMPTVADIANSGYMRIYLFQASAPLTVRDADTGDECLLNSGDLIRLAAPPNGTGVARTVVVTSRVGSCVPKQQVEVPLPDLQDMLNGFYLRVEDNMKRVQACTRRPDCLRT
ncbi:hypothetical protein [Ramlibacter sp.]|uniref:hypothetical protein n=1 Tax=Ramlibacter sp. TaxID=1917967 RepID=UPI002D7EABD3|nr:hypothetical protein [Ramlibacter sp.]